jgi:hypothetical protein
VRLDTRKNVSNKVPVALPDWLLASALSPQAKLPRQAAQSFKTEVKSIVESQASLQMTATDTASCA